jgi:small subunit ribosomal protein S8
MSQTSDPIADFLTRLRNASRASKLEVLVPYSKIKADMARVLKQEGYIANYEVETPEKGFPQIKIVNKLNNRATAITGLKRVSRPGLRRYVGSTEIPRVLGGMGVAILSTPRGILTGREAKKLNVGGEVLAYIW